MHLKKLGLLLLALCIYFSSVFSQGTIITPLAGNPFQPNKFNLLQASIITDTLKLPFFEDFTENAGWPNLKHWTEQQVWINNSFPVSPPSYNVATFDHLNEHGKPYSILNKNYHVYADSLTSQPIQLNFYKSGVNTFAYLPTDSIILSFYLQLKGIGDAPETDDSLILFFKTNTKKWLRVWSTVGGAAGDFKLITVPIDSSKYLFGDFQFRFVNYTKSTGNLNHWHLDYLRLEKYKKRSGGNDIKNAHDVAIVTASPTLFKNYFSLPYAHYKTDVLGQKLPEHKVTVRNLNTDKPVQTRFGYDVVNQYGKLVYSVPFSSSSRNINLFSDTTEKFQSFVLDTFSGQNPRFQVTYKIDPQSADATPDAYNTIGDNNKLTIKHNFTPWYAYDDGSAEGGFGLDYAFLGNIKGQFAMKFTNLKNDSLRGISVFFNRSESDVSFRNFSLRVWKALSPLGKADNQDQLMYEFNVDHPIYTDSINKFVYLFFDTVLFLPKGDFYIGWKQSQPYILNVGYDNNYRYNGQDVGNPNMFHNLLGEWKQVDYDVKGVPMLRPLFGVQKDYSFNTRYVSNNTIKIFPNPTTDRIFWDIKMPIKNAIVYAVDGKIVAQCKETNNSLSLENLKSGVYVVQLFFQNGQIISKQIIKK